MKPPPFEYRAPRALEEALALLADDEREVRPLAGGQSLVPVLNFRLASPDVLVDLGRIEALRGIDAPPGGGLVIGAMTVQRELERDPRVRERAPLLAEAAPWIAHAQIRNRGTVGGSLAHADPAAELPAVLLALGARVRLARAGGDAGPPAERVVALSDFFLGPFMTALEPGELLTRVHVPSAPAGEGTAFEEIARRRGDYAIAGVAVRVRLGEDGACTDAGIALVNAAPAPTLAPAAAAVLAGAIPDDDRIAAAAAAAADESRPSADMHGSEAYRRHLVEVLAARTLARAVARARGAEG